MNSKQPMISEHFSLNEMTRTKEKIDNVPNEAQVENLNSEKSVMDRKKNDKEQPSSVLNNINY